MNLVTHHRSTLQWAGLALGPILFIVIVLMNLEPDQPTVALMAGVAALMACWWITEAIPLAATALLPLILFPLLGIMPGKTVAPLYMNSTIFLFLGGFMIALAMERWNLHRRIALRVIRIIGGGPSRIVLGFMGATAFLSMWISNTATAVMMLPIGLSIIVQMESEFEKQDTHNFAVALMLGIAYAASMGGAATLVGTPPNLALQQIFAQTFPEAPPISFGLWMVMALPITVVMLALIWVILTKIFFRSASHLRVDRSVVDREYTALGGIGPEERVVLVVFVLTAVLWIFRTPLNLGVVAIPGWSALLPEGITVDDGTIAVAMALILFFIPTRSPEGQGQSATVLDSTVFQNLPWAIILLFGGGFALAAGFQESGLATYMGSQMGLLADFSPLAMVAVIATSLTFLTEVTSNTATTQMILPILASLGVAMGENPLLLMIPATLSASCAFMLPVATPPNAIVFGSGRLRIGEMVKAGLVINILGVIVISLLVYFLGIAIFGIDPGTQPDWAALSAAPE